MTIGNWLALLSIALTAAYTVFGFLIAWLKKVDARHDSLADKVASQDRYLSENYVRGHEIAEVKAAVSSLRTELTTAINAARTEQAAQMTRLSDLVNQLVGKHST